MLNIQGLTGGYGDESIIQEVSFSVGKGELFGILGPNGSGKTTLLKMLSGILSYKSGSISVKGRPLPEFSVKELAKVIAVLPQHSSQSFSYTVKETVSLGRYAHQKGWFQTWSEEDEKTVQRVMEQTRVAEFKDHYIHELSGGERQRVFLAQALAQEPEILLLDEPTNHLDLSFQKELLDLLRTWAKECGMTVVSIFHDLNLAALYCDRLLLMENGKVVAADVPNEVLREDRIRTVYQTDIMKHAHPAVPAPQMAILPGDLSAEPAAIGESDVQVYEDHVLVKSPFPLRTMSSGVAGSGVGWHRLFVNRQVPNHYDCSDHRAEMKEYLRENGYEPGETVGMMTAVQVADASYRLYESDGFSLLAVVTAGTGNAVDASRSGLHSFEFSPGTINTWIFINGNLTEEAFIQSIMTATETKVKVLHDHYIEDKVSGTLATGTSTDSILIAAAQSGKKLEFAGTITPLGKLISKAVYDCTAEALRKYRKRVSS